MRVVTTNDKIVSWWEDMNRKMARFSDRTDVTCICIPQVKNHDIGWRCHFCGMIEKEKSELVTHLVHCAGDENIWKTEMKNKEYNKNDIKYKRKGLPCKNNCHFYLVSNMFTLFTPLKSISN